MTSRMIIYIQVYCVINPKYKIKGDGIMLALKHSKQNDVLGSVNTIRRSVVADKDEMMLLNPYFDVFHDIESRKLNKVVLSMYSVHKIHHKLCHERKSTYKNNDDLDLVMEDIPRLDHYNSPFEEFSVVVNHPDNSIYIYMDIKYYDTPIFYQDNNPVKYLISAATDYDNHPTIRFMLIVTEDSTGKYNMNFINHDGNPIMSSLNKKFIYDISHPAASSNISIITGAVFHVLGTVLYMFNEKPEIFIESQEKYKVRDRDRRSGKKKNVKKHPIKVRKVFRIDDDHLEDFCSKSTHVITCESWEVSGHYRTYKNGKKVWIKPYRKGKNRDEVTSTPNTYII